VSKIEERIVGARVEKRLEAAVIAEVVCVADRIGDLTQQNVGRLSPS
jgi:hypothetical protein